MHVSSIFTQLARQINKVGGRVSPSLDEEISTLAYSILPHVKINNIFCENIIFS
jgi:hypothetical protein